MVIINGEKFACGRCIRGHRVSTCKHDDGPLIHIKPKGRPATQCRHCRESRKATSLHVKCICGATGSTSCSCEKTNVCICASKARGQVPAPARTPTGQGPSPIPRFLSNLSGSDVSSVPPMDSTPDTVQMSPSPPEDVEIDLGQAANPKQSPFPSWYPSTAEAYNRLPDSMPTFDYEDETAPLASAAEFVRLQMSQSRSAVELKNLAYSTHVAYPITSKSSVFATNVVEFGDDHHLATSMRASGERSNLNSWY